MDAIVFDFDGTLFDTEPLHEAALRAVCRPHGVCLDPGASIGLSDEDAIAGAFRASGVPIEPDRLSALCLEKTGVYETLILEAEITAYEGALELVGAATRRVGVAICTAAVRREVAPVIARFPPLPGVEVVVTADDVERKKPHPDGYRLAIERLGARPERSVAIEDSRRGVESARAAGLRVVGLGHTTPEARLPGVDLFRARIAELTVDAIGAVLAEPV